jgi:uncharacterized membrane protein
MGAVCGQVQPAPTATASGWATDAGDLVRAAAGGMLFGIPLLFTLEVWGIGSAATPPAMAAVLVLTFLPVILLVHTGGFRGSKDMSLPRVLREATEAVAAHAAC